MRTWLLLSDDAIETEEDGGGDPHGAHDTADDVVPARVARRHAFDPRGGGVTAAAATAAMLGAVLHSTRAAVRFSSRM